MQVSSIGIDLGKTTFRLVALRGSRKRCEEEVHTAATVHYSSNMPSSLIGLEACSGADFLGREIRKQGHDVRLIAA